MTNQSMPNNNWNNNAPQQNWGNAPVTHQQQGSFQPEMREPFPADIARFTLIAAQQRKSPNAPTHFGSVKINGCWFILSGWQQFNSRTGAPQMDVRMRPATQEEAMKAERREQEFQARMQQQQNNGGWGNPQNNMPNDSAAHFNSQYQENYNAGYSGSNNPNANPNDNPGAHPVNAPTQQKPF